MRTETEEEKVKCVFILEQVIAQVKYAKPLSNVILSEQLAEKSNNLLSEINENSTILSVTCPDNSEATKDKLNLLLDAEHRHNDL